jgi:hypothetical protein
MMDKGNIYFKTGAWAGLEPGGSICFQDSNGVELVRIDDHGIFMANGTKFEDAGELHAAFWKFLISAKIEGFGVEFPKEEMPPIVCQDCGMTICGVLHTMIRGIEGVWCDSCGKKREDGYAQIHQT